MTRVVLLITALLLAAGCSTKEPPPSQKNYQLEALQSEARQVVLFIDNWSGYAQKHSRIRNLSEYKQVKKKVIVSPEYNNFSDKEAFEGKINQFDAIVRRYEIWVEERSAALDEMDRFFERYMAEQDRLFDTNSKPLKVGSYEISVDNAYYEMIPDDPDQAYASALFIGLKQLDIIAASQHKPLRMPTLKLRDFVVKIRIANRSQDKLLRPDGFVVHRQSRNTKAGSYISRSFREYFVNFGDDRKNKYQFNRATNVINRDSANGIRPGESTTWTYSFNQDNYPIETVDKFHIGFPKTVFGKTLKLSIPLQVIAKPQIPATFH